jgi:hypothetical protein
MAITEADLDALDQAALDIAISGIATVTIAGQTTTVKSLKELRDFRNELAGQIASESTASGLVTRQLIPPGCG